jgi:hypothetical protein
MFKDTQDWLIGIRNASRNSGSPPVVSSSGSSALGRISNFLSDPFHGRHDPSGPREPSSIESEEDSIDDGWDQPGGLPSDSSSEELDDYGDPDGDIDTPLPTTKRLPYYRQVAARDKRTMHRDTR